MWEDWDWSSTRGKTVAVILFVTLGCVALADTLVAPEFVAEAIAILGWFILAPLVAILGVPWESDAGDGDASADGEDPLSILQRRYAEGELTEAEFERRVEALLESDAAVGPREGAVDPDSMDRPTFDGPSTDRDLEYDRN